MLVSFPSVACRFCDEASKNVQERFFQLRNSQNVRARHSELLFFHIVFTMNFIKVYSPLELSSYDFRTGKKFFPFRSLHYTSHFKPAEEYIKYSEQVKALPVPQRTFVKLRKDSRQLNSNSSGSVRSINSLAPETHKGPHSLFVGTGKSICRSTC